jgi:hypothetical protein
MAQVKYMVRVSIKWFNARRFVFVSYAAANARSATALSRHNECGVLFLFFESRRTVDNVFCASVTNAEFLFLLFESRCGNLFPFFCFFFVPATKAEFFLAFRIALEKSVLRSFAARDEWSFYFRFWNRAGEEICFPFVLMPATNADVFVFAFRIAPKITFFI